MIYPAALLCYPVFTMQQYNGIWNRKDNRKEKMKEILFGAAYYDEYMPCERLAEDVRMMKKAGINTVRIAESTWSTCEPQEGVFDFSHVERVLDAMEEAGIHVIVGTPTYAVPTWMVKSQERSGHLRGASDHGYYPSGLPVLCGAGHQKTDGTYGSQEMCYRFSGG